MTRNFMIVQSLILILLLMAFSVKAETSVDPFPGFNKGDTSAKAGDIILTPSYKMILNAVEQGPEKVSLIYYNAVMEKPGKDYSKVKFTFDGIQDIPNCLIIPIPAGQKAQKGDVLLTWWQSGSGMKRAYVVDASNPSEPVVKYIDIDYNNPAKNREGIPIGQMSEKLKPDTFAKLKDPFSPGTTVAVSEGPKRYSWAQVLRDDGKHLLVMAFASKVKIVEKSKCIPLPVIPDVKAGDTVQIPSIGTFAGAKVVKVDREIGRVFVERTLGTQKKEMIIAFGDVATGLDI